MKTCNDNSAPQASAEGLSASTRRELKRQLDSFVGDLARDVLGEAGVAPDGDGATDRGGRYEAG